MPDPIPDYEKGLESKRALPAERSAALNDEPHTVSTAKAPARRDLVFVLSKDLDSTTEALERPNLIDAKLVAPRGRFKRTGTLDGLARELAEVDSPIEKLILITHGSEDADLAFMQRGDTFVHSPATVASALEGTIAPRYAPRLIQFRGCAMGRSPAGMEQLRAALGADAIMAVNCFMVKKAKHPFTLDGTPITRKSQIERFGRETFDKGLAALIKASDHESFGDTKNCIVDRSPEAYFKTNGRLLEIFVDPYVVKSWDDLRSRCLDELPTETIAGESLTSSTPTPQPEGSPAPTIEVTLDCKWIRVERPRNTPRPR